MAQTRRQFLERLGATAGAAVTYEAMAAMGMLAVPARASAFSLQGSGNGTPVVVLGGGLAGMSAGYELSKLGYDVSIIEARTRPGGRCHTIRRGVKSEEEGSTAVCDFEEGHYYNPGPMRVPHHHTSTLGYARELGVPVEIFVNDNEAAYLYQKESSALAGTRLRRREVSADLSGYTAELLAKALPDLSLDDPLTDAEREALVAYLQRAGALQDGEYKGSARRGYVVPPAVGPGTVATPPLPLDDLLGSNTGMYIQTEYLQQAPMFQIVGGTDRLAAGFAARLGEKIAYGAEVQEIRQTLDGVEVTYTQGGQTRKVTGRYGICAMPMNIVSSLPVADIDAETKKLMSEVQFASSGKIGLQFKRRFWEEDDLIFGGISRTDQDITQIIYPSYGYLGSKGVVIGYYQTGPRAVEMAARTLAERTEVALAQGALLHPQYRQEFEKSFSVSWENVRYNKGAWAQMGASVREALSPRLLEPDRRLYFAGDHCSSLTAWMAGALESGQYVAKAIHARARQDAPQTAVA